jgi:hypothetical protein
MKVVDITGAAWLPVLSRHLGRFKIVVLWCGIAGWHSQERLIQGGKTIASGFLPICQGDSSSKICPIFDQGFEYQPRICSVLNMCK